MPIEMTVEEKINTLVRSDFPTVLVEGDSDLYVYRHIERLIGPTSVSLFPCGGKENVLRIHRELRRMNKNHIVAIVDSDFWTLDGVPAEYERSDIKLTMGYSIENDAILMGNLLKIMDQAEEQRFNDELRKYAGWYSVQIQFDRLSDQPTYRMPVHHALDNEIFYQESLAKYQNNKHCHRTIELVTGEPLFYVRGKNVMQILARQLSAPRRQPNHSAKSLLETAGANMGDYVSALVEWAKIELRI